MKKAVLLFSIFLCTFGTYGQIMVGVFGNINLYPSTGENRILIGKNGSSFDRFVNSYNSLNGSSLSTPLTPMKMKLSPNFGMNFMLGAFYSEIAYRSLRGTSEAVFTNGNRRVMEMKCNDLDVGIGFGKAGEKFYAYFAGFLNFGFGDKLNSYTVYPNGTESYGSENFLNGRYSALRFTARSGLRFGYKIKNHIWLTLFLDRVKQGKSSEYSDSLAGDVDTEFTGADLQYIGEDWPSYLNDPNSYILEDKALVQSGWSGLQVQFGINYLLGDNE